MKIISDLQIHSRFSLACSKNITVPEVSKFAKIKGINLIGTGDFTHPIWLEELKKHLTGEGIYTYNDSNFILSGEVSNIYKQDGKTRKIHNVLLAPSFEVVDQINECLSKIGKLKSDGRPILPRYSCIELVEDMKSISKDIEIIPAHVWTPWFGLFGSKGGFDTIKECFKEKTKHIYAIETGLSSDPAMNWKLSQLDDYTLTSNSDAHSLWPWRLGREANVFNFKELNYNSVIGALRNKKGFESTIEVNPNYGKYHIDGHRKCNVALTPEKTKKINGICPKCGGELTIGVLGRIEELADREEGYKPEGAIPFKHILPLSEVIAAKENVQVFSKKVENIHNHLIKNLGNEYHILLDCEEKEIAKVCDQRLTNIILKNREGKIKINPGYDGEYGKIELPKEGQASLF